MCVVGVLSVLFSVYDSADRFEFKKMHPDEEIFTHRTNSCTFYMNNLGFSFMGFLGTLPTLYENYIVFTFDR